MEQEISQSLWDENDSNFHIKCEFAQNLSDMLCSKNLKNVLIPCVSNRQDDEFASP